MVVFGADDRVEDVWLSAPARPFWALATQTATGKAQEYFIALVGQEPV
jgi:hypothetical protein